MEKIFTCTLSVDGNETNYDVVFADEEYIFTSQNDSVIPKNFKLIRDQDVWKTVDEKYAPITDQAKSALEKYLLSQH